MNFAKLVRSFDYALKGLAHLLKTQQNFRIELILAMLATIVGLYFNISANEWLALCIAMAMVLAAEAFNSAIEELMDLVCPQRHPKAGLIKDISAGAVLIIALGALVDGLIIFFPKILNEIGS